MYLHFSRTAGKLPWVKACVKLLVVDAVQGRWVKKGMTVTDRVLGVDVRKWGNDQ